MANQFLALPAPAANGSGAAVDLSSFGALKTLTVADLAGAFVTIEMSNQASPTKWAPVTTFLVGGERTVSIAARWVRATVTNYQGGGAPVVNVGGEDTGTSFATLVAPAGNGVGAGIDVSALPALKTVQLIGAFKGAVNIELSDNGGTTYVEVVSFRDSGFQTFVAVADFMRVKRNGIVSPPGSTPLVELAATEPAGNGGGSSDLSASNVLTFRPGSIDTGPVVFNDFDDLYAQLVSLRTAAQASGLYTIVMDDTDGAVVIPAAAYDMTGTSWDGSHGPTTFNPVAVEITDGAAITHLLGITGLAVTKTVVGTPPIAVAAGEVLTITMATIYSGQAGMELITASGAFAMIRLEDLGILGSFAMVLDSGANTGLLLQGGASAANDDSVADDGSTTLLVYVQSSAAIYGTMSGFSGTETIQQFPAAWDWGRGDPNGVVSGNLGALLIDSATGNAWNNNDGGTGWTLSAASSSVPPQVVHSFPAIVAAGTGKWPLTLGEWQPVGILTFDGGANYPLVAAGKTIYVTVIFTIQYLTSAGATTSAEFDVALSVDIGPDWNPSNIGTVLASTNIQPNPDTVIIAGERATVTSSFQIAFTGDGAAHTLTVVINPDPGVSALTSADIEAKSPGAYVMLAFIPTDGFVP